MSRLEQVKYWIPSICLVQNRSNTGYTCFILQIFKTFVQNNSNLLRHGLTMCRPISRTPVSYVSPMCRCYELTRVQHCTLPRHCSFEPPYVVRSGIAFYVSQKYSRIIQPNVALFGKDRQPMIFDDFCDWTCIFKLVPLIIHTWFQNVYN